MLSVHKKVHPLVLSRFMRRRPCGISGCTTRNLVIEVSGASNSRDYYRCLNQWAHMFACIFTIRRGSSVHTKSCLRSLFELLYERPTPYLLLLMHGLYLSCHFRNMASKLQVLVFSMFSYFFMIVFLCVCVCFCMEAWDESYMFLDKFLCFPLVWGFSDSPRSRLTIRI